MLRSALETLRDRGPLSLAHAARNLATASIERQLLGRRFVERPIYDYRMLLDLDDAGISRSLLLFGQRELDHKAMLEDAVRPGMRIFDIGANIGYYVLMELGLIGPEGEMVAVEPSPSNVALLRRNLALNGLSERVTVIEAAVSDACETRSFHLAHQSNLNTFHTDGSGAVHLSGKTIDVATTTVARLAEAHGAPDLLRMDVEGHEVSVIRGLLPAVEAGEMAPMIIFETHLSRYGAENDMAATLRALFDCGYGIRSLASSQASGTARIEALGYRGAAPIPTDGVERVIFEAVSAEHAVELICRTGGVRTVLLAKD